MSRKGKVTFVLDENFDKWRKWVNDCERAEVGKMRDRIGRTAGIRGMDHARTYTGNRRTSRLDDSLIPGGTENIFRVEPLPGVVVVVYGSAVPYAAAVELGYDQRHRVSKATGKVPSLFVPGFWQGDTFKYVPGFKTGMVLTGKIIEGKHMFEKSLDDLKGDLSEIYVNALRELWNTLL